jgi:hypothetical protein
VAAAYPDNPAASDKSNAIQFLDLFTDTITCRICKEHFSRIYRSYVTFYPDYLNNKRNFFIFTLRAHNEVNRSLDKPLLTSINDCLVSLKNACSVTPIKTFKDNYMSYLIRTWAHEMTGDALIYKSKAIAMRELLTKINLTNCFNVVLDEDDVSSYRLTVPKRNNISHEDYSSIRIGFSGGRLKLR